MPDEANNVRATSRSSTRYDERCNEEAKRWLEWMRQYLHATYRVYESFRCHGHARMGRKKNIYDSKIPITKDKTITYHPMSKDPNSYTFGLCVNV